MPVARPPAATATPLATPPPEVNGIQPGAYYVVRGKTAKNGSYYLVCSIMGDATTRYFGYAVTAEQYARTELGLVYDYQNMRGWRRVNKIE